MRNTWERWREYTTRGYSVFATLQSRIQRVESLYQRDVHVVSPLKCTHKCTWRKKVLCSDLPFSPSAYFPLVISHSSLECLSLIPENKCLPRVIVSSLYFYSISLVAAISDLSSEIKLFFFVTVHKTRPLNTEQCLPIAIIDNTVYNNESDVNN